MKQVNSRNRIPTLNLNTDNSVVVCDNEKGSSNTRTAKAINALYQYRYIRYLREAKGRKEGTIRKAEDALRRWFAFTRNRTLKARLLDNTIVSFKEKLRKTQANRGRLSPGTVFDILLQLKCFFEWLGQQSGFKCLVNASTVAYFSPNREEIEYRKYRNRKMFPTLQQVKLLVSSIPNDSILGRRDRAFISLLLLSGIRIDAAVSLILENLDPVQMVLDQDPYWGVRTKFSKRINTVIIPFDYELYRIIREWYDELLGLGFGYNDPLFPKAKIEVEGITFISSGELARGFVSASRMRKVIAGHCVKAALPRFNPHSFRHACVKLAMDLAKDGKTIKAISTSLGHKSAVHLIDTYGQMTDQDIWQSIHSMMEEK